MERGVEGEGSVIAVIVVMVERLAGFSSSLANIGQESSWTKETETLSIRVQAPQAKLATNDRDLNMPAPLRGRVSVQWHTLKPVRT